MGYLESDLYIFHGTRTAYDSIRLPGEVGFVSEVGQASGSAFYTFATTDPELIETVRDNARVYARDGMLLSGTARAGEYRIIDGEAPIGEEMRQLFRERLARANTGHALLDQYYHNLAETLTPETSGRTLWGSIQGDTAISQWSSQRALNDLDGNVTGSLRRDRSALNRALQNHGIEDGFASLDNFTPEHRSALATELRKIPAENGTYSAFYNGLADQVESGRIAKGSELFSQMHDSKHITAAARKAAPSAAELPTPELMDAQWNKIIGELDIGGISYATDGGRTVLFQGDAGMRQLPSLHVEELHGNPPVDRRANPREIRVGDEMLPRGGGRAAPVNDPAADVKDSRFHQQAGVGNLDTPERAAEIRARNIADQTAAQAAAKAKAQPSVPETVVQEQPKWSHSTDRPAVKAPQASGASAVEPDASVRASDLPDIQEQRSPKSLAAKQMQQQQQQTKLTFPADDVAGPAPQALQKELKDALTREAPPNTRGPAAEPTLQEKYEYLMKNHSEPNPIARPDEPILNATEKQYAEQKSRGPANAREPEWATKERARLDRLKALAEWDRLPPVPDPVPDMRTAAAPKPDMPHAPHVPDAPHMPHRPKATPKVGGAAGVVLMGGITAGFAKADQRDGETYGHAFERTVEQTFVTSFLDPIASVQQGDYGMATAQVFDNTGVAVSERLKEFRMDDASRAVTAEQKQELEQALPKGNMSLGSANPRLNLIAELLAYRDQGVDYLTLYESPFSALPGIAGPGMPGLVMSEGQRGGKTSDLLDEHIRKFIVEGGSMQSIREALDKDYFKEQNYIRLRNVVPDQFSVGYKHYTIEARDGMQELEAFRALIQSGADKTMPEARDRAINLAYEYLMAQDFDESRMLRNAAYQMTRSGFLIAREEDFIAAGMGPLFNITGNPENKREDRENLMKVLNQPSGGPDGETIFDRIQPGSDRVAMPADIYAALPPELQAQVKLEQGRMAAAAAAPAPVPKPEPVPEPEEIVVTGQRYKDAPYDKKLSGKQHKMLEENGLKAFVDNNNDGVLQLGELRAALENAGVTIPDNGKVNDQQLAQALPKLLASRDDQSRSV